MNTVLEVEQVDHFFRVGFLMKQVQILFEVSLSVPERSIFGFLGLNGAGKTTLIQLIAGLRKASKGRVKIFGEDATSIEARTRLGYLPERPYFHEHLTGEGLLNYYGKLSGLSRVDISARIPSVLEKVGMSHARKVELRKYSKGMLQRIGMAQALIHDPEFLLLDEPMSGLDPLGRREMRELIKGLKKEGRTLFFSSHVISDVEEICDQVAFIQKGRITDVGPVSAFLSKGPMEDLL